MNIDVTKGFRFFHNEEPELIYSWFPDEELVTWYEKVKGKSVQLDTKYTTPYVKELVDSGEWVVVE